MTPADRHRWARPILIDAWNDIFSAPPTPAEAQTLHAQGGHEGWFGFASKPPEWFGSNNWGACDYLDGDENRIQGCTGFFESHDHDVNGVEISVRFRMYATPRDGARDLINEAIVRRVEAFNVISSGNLLAYARALRADHYFVAPAEDYAVALYGIARDAAAALGEPLAVAFSGDGPDTQGGSVDGGTSSALLLLLAVGGYYLLRGR